MFWIRKCRNCDNKIDVKWSFCPSCGSPLKEVKGRDIFKQVDKEFKQIDHIMEMKLPRFMLKPLNAKGVSITITSDNASSPRIDMHTYGGQKHQHNHHHEDKPVRIAKTTEEPEAKVSRTDNKEVIKLNLPDVKSLEDIEIRQLNQSIEIKAFAGDKTYFKLIPVPSNATVNNEFKDGVLKIEVMK